MKTFSTLCKELKEDAPANAVGGGAIAGVGIGPQGEPGGKKSVMKSNNSTVMTRNK